MYRLPTVVHLAASGLLAANLALIAASAGAQEASPAATPEAACTVAPRSVDELIGFYFSPEGTPLATPAPVVTTSETELPQGEPVDAETEAAVNAVVTELFACFDAGQYARAFALMTDDLARQFGPDVSNPNEDTPAEVRTLLEAQLAGTPVGASEGQQTQVGAGRDIRMLSPGRVGGIWTIEGDSAFLAFTHQSDGRWLIDEIIFVVGGAGAGTPTS
jgi:hypothetical protein